MTAKALHFTDLTTLLVNNVKNAKNLPDDLNRPKIV